MLNPVLVLAAAALAASASAQSVTSLADEKAVLDADRQWQEAARSIDTVAMERILADDYVGVSITGQVGSKTTNLERLRAITPEQKAALAKVEGSQGDLKVRIYGNVAVVMGQGNVRGPNDTFSTRFIRVWVKSNDQWRLTTFQVTRIAPPPVKAGSSTSNTPPSLRAD